MKIYKILIIIIFIISKSNAQKILEPKEIEIIVKNINEGKYEIKKDSLIQNNPEYGMKMKTYLTAVIDGKNLKKYENFVYSLINQTGINREITTSSTFYYDKNSLIKVEEYMIEGDSKKTIDWYFFEDKLLYHNFKSKKAEERGTLLLNMSKEILKQTNK